MLPTFCKQQENSFFILQNMISGVLQKRKKIYLSNIIKFYEFNQFLQKPITTMTSWGFISIHATHILQAASIFVCFLQIAIDEKVYTANNLIRRWLI